VASSDDLVRSIRTIQVMDCLADPTKIRVVAVPSTDLGPALPYLATLLSQAGYNHEAGILTLVYHGRLLTVYRQLVTLAKALNEEDAETVLEWLRRTINQAYEQRNHLAPCLGRRRSSRLLDIYQLLPRDNCRRCGEATCMALAARLAFGEAHLSRCPRLNETQYASNRLRLAEWLGAERPADP